MSDTQSVQPTTSPGANAGGHIGLWDDDQRLAGLDTPADPPGSPGATEPNEGDALGESAPDSEPAYKGTAKDQLKALDEAREGRDISPALRTALRSELRSMLDDDEDFDAEHLLMVAQFAHASTELLNIRNPLNRLRKRRGGISIGSSSGFPFYSSGGSLASYSPTLNESDGSMAPAPVAETFGAQVTRQGVGAINKIVETVREVGSRLTDRHTQAGIGELTTALREAKLAGETDIADQIRARIGELLQQGVETPTSAASADPTDVQDEFYAHVVKARAESIHDCVVTAIVFDGVQKEQPAHKIREIAEKAFAEACRREIVYAIGHARGITEEVAVTYFDTLLQRDPGWIIEQLLSALPPQKRNLLDSRLDEVTAGMRAALTALSNHA